MKLHDLGQHTNSMRSPVRGVVFADDLTGALEVGVLSRNSGLPTRVHVRSALTPIHDRFDGISVIDTFTRECGADDACALLAAYSAEWRDDRNIAILKKTDSLLRGNIAPELAWLARAYPQRRVVYVPAYPLLGRVVRGGVLYVREDGERWLEHANIPKRFLEWERSPGFRLVRDVESLEKEFGEPGGRILICDGETQDEVDAIAGWLKGHLTDTIVAGPSGVFRKLFGGCGFSVGPFAEPIAESGVGLIGSCHPVAIGQLGEVVKFGAAVVISGTTDIRGASGQESRIAEEWQKACSREWILACPNWPPEAVSCDPLHRFIERTLRTLSREILALCQPSVPDAYFLSGGETAEVFLSEAGIAELHPERELLPGVVLSSAKIEGKPVRIVTKSGAFGEPDMLLRVLEVLKGRGATT